MPLPQLGMGQEEFPESLGQVKLLAPNEGSTHTILDTNTWRDRNDKIYPKQQENNT